MVTHISQLAGIFALTALTAGCGIFTNVSGNGIATEDARLDIGGVNLVSIRTFDLRCTQRTLPEALQRNSEPTIQAIGKRALQIDKGECNSDAQIHEAEIVDVPYDQKPENQPVSILSPRAAARLEAQ